VSLISKIFLYFHFVIHVTPISSRCHSFKRALVSLDTLAAGISGRCVKPLSSGWMVLKMAVACLCYDLRCESHRRINMAANALVTTRIDPNIKAEAAAVLAEIGLTVSDAVRLMLIRVAREHALPFEPLVPNAETIQAMKDSMAGKVEWVESVDALFDGLDE
jgi:DNA-damage-inducible protein J